MPAGTSRFVLSADAPDPAKIPAADLLGVTVVLVCCAYRGQEFLRIGYYVNNEAPEGEAPSKANVTRTLLAEQPRVTRVDIDEAGAVALVILGITALLRHDAGRRWRGGFAGSSRHLDAIAETIDKATAQRHGRTRLPRRRQTVHVPER